MNALLDIAISNTALASLAAGLAWAVGRLLRRPALTHALWLIVLIKLVTPPIWNLPVHREPKGDAPAQSQTPAELPGDLAPRAPADLRRPTLAEIAMAPDLTSTSSAWVNRLPEQTSIETPTVLTPTIPVHSEITRTSSPARQFPLRQFFLPLVESLWLGGSLIYLGVSLRRIARFARTLRFASPAPPVVRLQVEALARRMGIRRAPGVLFVPGAVCPMLWAGAGRARVLLPSELWKKLEDSQHQMLLVHELAHRVRRDHWVRWLELLVTALYWWNPVCWWARRELREAEEQCCDAWVLWMTPGSFREYASALLEAVDFVSASRGETPRQVAVPTLASGMGQFGQLKRRLTMLKTGHVARALGWGGWTTTLGVGALLLPIAGTLAQDTSSTSKDEARTSTVAPAQQSSADAKEADTAIANKSEDSAPRAGALAPVNAPPLGGVAEDVAPLAKDAPPLEGQSGYQAPGSAPSHGVPAARTSSAQQRDANFRRELNEFNRNNVSNADLRKELDEAKRQFDDAARQFAEAQRRLQKLQAAAGLPQAQSAYELRIGQNGAVTMGQAPGGYPAVPGAAANNPYLANRAPEMAGPGPRTYQPQTESDRDRRLDALEAQLHQLIDELHQLRSESHNQNGAPQAAPSRRM